MLNPGRFWVWISDPDDFFQINQKKKFQINQKKIQINQTYFQDIIKKILHNINEEIVNSNK